VTGRRTLRQRDACVNQADCEGVRHPVPFRNPAPVAHLPPRAASFQPYGTTRHAATLHPDPRAHLRAGHPAGPGGRPGCGAVSRGDSRIRDRRALHRLPRRARVRARPGGGLAAGRAPCLRHHAAAPRAAPAGSRPPPQSSAAGRDPRPQPRAAPSGDVRGAGGRDRPHEPGGGVLLLRRARQRVLVARSGDVDGLGPGAGGVGVGRRPRLPRRDHRPELEPGRPRALRAVVPPDHGGDAEREPAGPRALGAVAGGAIQPLPLRPQPRLGLGDAAGDAGATRDLGRLEPPGARGLPRDGVRVDLLLLPGGRPHQPHLPGLRPRLGPQVR
jgi:hypothetical protein